MEPDFAVLAPTVETSPLVCADILRSNKPFACLMPQDLVSFVATADEGDDSETLQHRPAGHSTKNRFHVHWLRLDHFWPD